LGIFTVLIFIFVLSGLNFYLAHRLCRGLSLVLPWLRTGILFAVLTIFSLLTILGFLRSGLSLAPLIKRILRWFFAMWLGLYLYLLLYTVLADILSLLPRLLGMTVSAKVLTLRSILILTLSAVTVLYGGIHASRIQTVTYQIPLEHCTREMAEMNIVLISDLHLGAVGSENRLEDIVRRINALEPDLLCIAGDFFDSDFFSIEDPGRARETLLRLQSTHGIYACLGNHDAGSTYPQMAAFLDSCGIRVLSDTYEIIGDQLILAGRPDRSPIGGFGGLTRQESLLLPEDMDLPVIVLDHNPAHGDSYGSKTDLILSGHTHKGQIFPGSLITGKMYTVDYGHYRYPSGVQAVVTSGVGYWGMPLRIGSDCEIVQIKLVDPS